MTILSRIRARRERRRLQHEYLDALKRPSMPTPLSYVTGEWKAYEPFGTDPLRSEVIAYASSDDLTPAEIEITNALAEFLPEGHTVRWTPVERLLAELTTEIDTALGIEDAELLECIVRGQIVKQLAELIAPRVAELLA